MFTSLTNLIYACICLVYLQLANAGLFSPTVDQAVAYSSSALDESNPQFAIDQDWLSSDHPTCFESDPARPDADGFHWLLVDFGYPMRRIKELRLISGQGESIRTSQSPSQQLQAFVITDLKTAKQDFDFNQRRVAVNQSRSLAWNSTGYNLCWSNSTTPVASSSGSGQDVVNVIRCQYPLTGRWLAVRDRRPLRVCMLSVYVEKAFSSCFDLFVPSKKSLLAGLVYRQVKHLSPESCREHCLKDRMCQGIKFKSLGYNGDCELIKGLYFKSTTLNDEDVGVGKVLKCSQRASCRLEINYCHLGTITKLTLPGGLPQQLTMTQSKDEIEGHRLLDEYHFLATIKLSLDQDKLRTASESSLFLVRLIGTVECSAWDCGLLHVFTVSRDQKVQSWCGTFNTKLVKQLDKIHLFCAADRPLPTNVHAIKLAWKPPPSPISHHGEDDLEEAKVMRPEIKVNLTQAFVRLFFGSQLRDRLVSIFPTTPSTPVNSTTTTAETSTLEININSPTNAPEQREVANDSNSLEEEDETVESDDAELKQGTDLLVVGDTSDRSPQSTVEVTVSDREKEDESKSPANREFKGVEELTETINIASSKQVMDFESTSNEKKVHSKSTAVDKKQREDWPSQVEPNDQPFQVADNVRSSAQRGQKVVWVDKWANSNPNPARSTPTRQNRTYVSFNPKPVDKALDSNDSPTRLHGLLILPALQLTLFSLYRSF